MGGIDRRSMGDRQNRDERSTVTLPPDTKHDDARTILAALFVAGLMLVMPEIAEVEDETRLGRRKRHELSSLPIEESI